MSTKSSVQGAACQAAFVELAVEGDRAGWRGSRHNRVAEHRRRRAARSAGDRLSQTRTVPSPEAEISRVPSGLQSTAWT